MYKENKMSKQDDTVVTCLLGSGELCEESCPLFKKCWDEVEINRKKNEQTN